MSYDDNQISEPLREPAPVYCLKGLSGVTTGKCFSLTGETYIGRRQDCQIVLSAPGISRQHARIGLNNERYFLQDMESANGTFVNGIRIDTILLSPGDEISFDNIRFVFKESATGNPADDESISLQATLRRDMQARLRRTPPPEPNTEPVTRIMASKPKTSHGKGWVIGMTALSVALLAVLILGVGWLVLRH